MTRTITIIRELSDQLLKDILTTAVEGGINYWASGRATREEDLSVIEFAIRPAESEDEFEPQTVTLDTVAEGMRKVLDPDFDVNQQIRSDILEAINEDDASYIDAMDADVIIQAGVFGEIVYG